MIIDVIDRSDLGEPRRIPQFEAEKKEVRDWIANIRKLGGDPIIVYGTSDALGYVVDRIINRAGAHRMITLLRLHGHGAPGIMSIVGGEWTEMSRHLADFGPRRREMARRTLEDLRPYFAPYSHAELHGCEVASGREGRRLIKWLADTLGVPVSAGVRSQYDSGGAETFIFEGPVLTAYPSGKIRRTSAAGVPGGYSGF